jgi:hypothetical protein
MIRFASLLAAGALAGLSAPAFPQDHAPPLPPLDAAQPDEPTEFYTASDPAPEIDPAPRPEPAPPAPLSRLAYSAEQRLAWLGQCRAAYGNGDTCETYLAQYERAATDPLGYYGVRITRSRRTSADDDCPDDASAMAYGATE